MEGKITNFFKRNTQAAQDDAEDVFDSDDDELFLEVSEQQKDLQEHENMLIKNSELKKKTKIVLIKKTAGGSQVWNYFGQMVISNKNILKDYNICRLCFEETPMKVKGFCLSTGTSNLRNHLQSSHSIDISSKIAESTNRKTKIALSGNGNLLNVPKTQKFANARLLVQMCCRDLRPFNMVEQPGFVDYIQSIKPNIQMPASTTLSRSAIEDVYAIYKNTVKQFVKENSPENISLVLDMWTDSYKRSYINVRVIFCHKFNPICITLKTENFPHPHNKFTIAQNINETLKDFALQYKEIVVVSDGGSNIVAAMKLNKMKRLGCCSHSLHRFIVHDIMQNAEFTVFSNTANKLKRIFKCLNYNTENILQIQKSFENDVLFNALTEATDIFNIIENEIQYKIINDDDDDFEIGEILKTQPLGTLKNSNDTRWNTLCYMFRSFSKNERVVNIALLEIGKAELTLNSMEKLMVKEFLEFLEIFEEATKHLQGRKYPTVNCNIVFFENIMDVLQTKADKVSFSETIHMYSYAKIQFPKRFKIYKIHLVAALLDPIQKSWPRLDKWIKKVSKNMDLYDELKLDDVNGGISRKEILHYEIQKLYITEENVEKPTTSTSAKKQKLDRNAASWSIASFVAATSDDKQVDPLKEEINKYFEATCDDPDTFNWWEKNEKEYPKIAKLAAAILSVPATSASSEEAFSSAGSLISAKRSNLNALTIKRVLFIHDNYELVNKIIKK